VIGFPLLIIPFAIYNMIAFITPMDWGTKLYTFRLMSGLDWSPTLGDAFIAFSLLILMFEVIKCIRHGRSFVEHFLVLVLAGGAAAEFVMVKETGTSIFMLFVVICFVDLLSGFAAGLRRARRAVVVEQGPVVVVPAPAPAPAPTVVRTEPTRVEVAPAPRVEPSPFAPASEPVVKADPVQKIGS